jgi:hypothetical protein
LGRVQATVERYDEGTGRLILDDGTQLPFSAAALAGSGIRLLHAGQRVSVTVADGAVRRLWLPGIGEPAGAAT